MKLLISGGRLIDPRTNLDQAGDILVVDGLIAQVGGKIPVNGARKLDASGLTVAPGLVDLHTHLREPGREDEETVASGTRAAAAGGFTTVTAMANTDPPADNASVIRYLREKAGAEGAVRVEALGAITKGLAGKELAPLAELAGAGARGFSDDGRGVARSDVMRRAFEYARLWDLPLILHCEDADLSSGGQMNEGYWSTFLGLAGMPAAAEEIMIERDLRLAERYGGKVHITHVSTAESVELIRSAKERGVAVTCDVTPHHVTLSEETVAGYDTNFKMNPPLRRREDVDALRRGLADGTIDAVATDHAPHAVQEKEREFGLAPFGVVGLETALGVCLTELVPEVLSLGELLSRLSLHPSEILGLGRGALEPGKPGDVLVFDPDASWTVDPGLFRSLSRNTAFSGRSLRGKVIHTVVGGRAIVEEGEIRC